MPRSTFLSVTGSGLVLASILLPSGPHPARRPLEREADLDERYEARSVSLAPLPQPLDGGGPLLSADAVPQSLAERLLPALSEPGSLWDELAFVRRAHDLEWWVEYPEHLKGGWLQSSNNLGLRSPRAVLGQRPRLRALILGDVNAEGRCAFEEGFGQIAEARLTESFGERVEVLNAGIAGGTPYGVSGTLGRLNLLRAHVAVWLIDTGSDFERLMPLQRWLHRRPAPLAADEVGLDRARDDARFGAGVEAELRQAAYLAANPEDESVGVSTLGRLASEVDRCAWLTGSSALVLLLPSAATAQPAHFESVRRHLAGEIGLDAEEAAVADRLHARLLLEFEQRGLAVMDLRPVLANCERACFWWNDLLLSPRGQERVGRALAQRLHELAR